MSPSRPAFGQCVVVVEGHRAVGLDHHTGRAAHRPQPLAEVGRVVHRGRQAHEGDLRRREHEDLLPHRSSVGVLEVVDLVEHDHLQPLQEWRPGEEHVAEHLGGHHHHRRLRLVRDVAGQQADPVATVTGRELGEFLVGEGLDRRRVERLAARLEGPGHCVLGDERLSRAGRGADQDRFAAVDRLHRLLLKGIERTPRLTLEAIATVCARRLRGVLVGAPGAPGAHRRTILPTMIESS